MHNREIGLHQLINTLKGREAFRENYWGKGSHPTLADWLHIIDFFNYHTRCELTAKQILNDEMYTQKKKDLSTSLAGVQRGPWL